MRKSSRIAEMENEPQTWRKPRYKPGVYNYNEICEFIDYLSFDLTWITLALVYYFYSPCI